MFQYHCLNPIAEKGLGLFDEEYKKKAKICRSAMQSL